MIEIKSGAICYLFIFYLSPWKWVVKRVLFIDLFNFLLFLFLISMYSILSRHRRRGLVRFG